MSRCKVRRIRVADFIADFIVEKGVKDFFLLPGGGAMHLVDALGNHKELNYVACHHEQTCSIAAESYARVTENFGVALVTTGPGATNAITGVVGAWIESVPIMIFSGQVKRADMIGRRKIRQGGVQEVDIVSMVKNYTKYAVTVKEPEKIKYFLEKAYFLMKSGRMGPVWLDIPLDVQASLVYPDGLEGFTPEGVEYSDLNELEKIMPFSKFYVAFKDDVPQGCAVLPYNKLGVYYLYGGSIQKPFTGSLNLMHYTAMLDFKSIGVLQYDFMGARLNVSPGSRLEGIQRFKKRFGGKLRTGFLWKYEFRPYKVKSIYFIQKFIYCLQNKKYVGDAIDQELFRYV